MVFIATTHECKKHNEWRAFPGYVKATKHLKCIKDKFY